MFGNPLVILGLQVSISSEHVVFQPDEEKRVKWLRRIEIALLHCSLSAGAASKLAGALSWTAQSSFRRLGRALLTPLYQHAHARKRRGRNFKRNKALGLALRWWQEVLQLELFQKLPVRECNQPWVHLFAGSRGSQPLLPQCLS